VRSTSNCVQAKEAEAARVTIELKLAREREAALGRDLNVANTSLTSVRKLVSELQSANGQLSDKVAGLERQLHAAEVRGCGARVCVCVWMWAVDTVFWPALPLTTSDLADGTSASGGQNFRFTFIW
jgi:hypothetical protein